MELTAVKRYTEGVWECTGYSVGEAMRDVRRGNGHGEIINVYYNAITAIADFMITTRYISYVVA